MFENSKFKIVIIVACMLFLFVGFVFINKKINAALTYSKKELESPIKAESDSDKGSNVDVTAEPITSRRRIEPNRKFYENVFFRNGEEIARFKTINDEIYDFVGEKFSGVVAFEDFTNNRKGTQEYLNGKREGKLKEYYQTGELRRVADYSDDKIIGDKVYFIDGVLRKEVDLMDASFYTDNNEVGFGKVYFRNGVLRYEWRFLNSEFGGYNKSFNLDGVLVEENYYDSFGVKITKDEYYEKSGSI